MWGRTDEKDATGISLAQLYVFRNARFRWCVEAGVAVTIAACLIVGVWIPDADAVEFDRHATEQDALVIKSTEDPTKGVGGALNVLFTPSAYSDVDDDDHSWSRYVADVEVMTTTGVKRLKVTGTQEVWRGSWDDYGPIRRRIIESDTPDGSKSVPVKVRESSGKADARLSSEVQLSKERIRVVPWAVIGILAWGACVALLDCLVVDPILSRRRPTL